jgi:hypothetical protein
MVDNPALRGPQDRNRIAMQEEHEVRYWTDHLRVTRDQLQTAVNAVGHSAHAVREYLATGDGGTRVQQAGEGGTTRFGMEDGDNTDVPATGLEPDQQSGR